MDNILYKTFGKRVYKAILNLIGSGGSDGGVEVIKVNSSEEFPFIETNTKNLYTKLVIGEGAAEADIQKYQALINDNIKLANSIIQNYNSDKPIFIIVDTGFNKSIGSGNILGDYEFIYVASNLQCTIPINRSLDGKATLRDYPYTISGK